ncbi:MAG: hypothetical protein K2R98_05090 [Gemmataceae bacterium]|nr:hypothetical protein [Gemmataceae bacterium]
MLSLYSAVFLALMLGQDGGKWSEVGARATYAKDIDSIQQMEADAIRALADDKGLEKRPNGAYYSIKFLESLRSTKAIPVLCDHLLYEQKVMFYNNIVVGREAFPASGALVAIGLPAVDGLLSRIGSFNVSDKYRQVAFGVIEEIVDRENLIMTLDRFEERVKKIQEFPNDRNYKKYKDVDIKRIESFKAEVRRKLKQPT